MSNRHLLENGHIGADLDIVPNEDANRAMRKPGRRCEFGASMEIGPERTAVAGIHPLDAVQIPELQKHRRLVAGVDDDRTPAPVAGMVIALDDRHHPFSKR